LGANNEQQKESNRVRELQLADNAFKQMISTEERLFYEMEKRQVEN
jgi:hypothetical protein